MKMSQNDSDEIRSAAELLVTSARRAGGGIAGNYNGVPPIYDMSRTHSINLFTEEFLGGYMQDGRMSVVRRFFCLFVTFDLIFVSLLWLICIMINGDNIFQAFQKQIMHYTIYTSLFDVVAAAIFRFLILILFYAILYVNHWSIITFTTSGSCLFLISKVFVFDWVDSKEQVFEVILIITSFILAWGEAWFLDCRVIPQERHARHYLTALTTTNDRSPLMAPFLASQSEHPPESVANFYSPLDTAPHSDDEDEEDEEYNKMGLDCLRKAYELFESSDWKVEKVSTKGDTIYTTQRDKIGKIFKLTGRIKYNAKSLMEELFYRIEDMPKWNPTLLESKIVRKINSYTDITYQASVGGGGGMVKSRDFVNLRSFRLFRNGRIHNIDEDGQLSSDDEEMLNRSCEGSVSTVSEDDSTPLPGSVGSTHSCETRSNLAPAANPFLTLSKSLGAKGFVTVPSVMNYNDEPPPLDEQFEDAKDRLDDVTESFSKHTLTDTPPMTGQSIQGKAKEKVWVSAAISIDYKQVPQTNKYIRGQNIVSGFALREIPGKNDACIFEWVLCLDLKGYIPRYVLDAALTSFMTDYMTYLRKYVNEMRQTRRRVPRN